MCTTSARNGVWMCTTSAGSRRQRGHASASVAGITVDAETARRRTGGREQSPGAGVGALPGQQDMPSMRPLWATSPPPHP
jgi:hypothetical protein